MGLSGLLLQSIYHENLNIFSFDGRMVFERNKRKQHVIFAFELHNKSQSRLNTLFQFLNVKRLEKDAIYMLNGH